MYPKKIKFYIMEGSSSQIGLPNITAQQVKEDLSNQCLYIILLGLSFPIYKIGKTTIRILLWIL